MESKKSVENGKKIKERLESIDSSNKYIINDPHYAISSYSLNMEESGDIQNPEAEEKEELVLPNWIYYSVTLFLFVGIVAASSFIEDVETVIKFIGSMANAILNFTFPGLFYFIIMRRHNKEKAKSENSSYMINQKYNCNDFEY
mmetsp:Transcript_31367/g.27712  ORF Transcript_31367/g.27712 Transcript_31367/m.27712 type:complete len:144 (+) Transcript_31367:1073-1504(+)